MKPLDLNDLDTHRTVTLNGVTHTVKAITPRVLFIVDAGDKATGVEQIRQYCKAVAALIPSMSPEDVEGLSFTNLLAVVGLASEQVEAVEDAVPKAESPAATPDPAAT